MTASLTADPKTYAIGDPCPTCGSGRIGQSGSALRCANCGWIKYPTEHSSRPVMNSPADEAEARDRANTAPRQADHDAACRGKTGSSSWPEARPVTATALLTSKTESRDMLIAALQELAGKLTDSSIYEAGISHASVYATVVREAIEVLSATPETRADDPEPVRPDRNRLLHPFGTLNPRAQEREWAEYGRALAAWRERQPVKTKAPATVLDDLRELRDRLLDTIGNDYARDVENIIAQLEPPVKTSRQPSARETDRGHIPMNCIYPPECPKCGVEHYPDCNAGPRK